MPISPLPQPTPYTCSHCGAGLKALARLCPICREEMPEFELRSFPFSIVMRMLYGLGIVCSIIIALYGVYAVHLSIEMWGAFADEEADMRSVPYLMTLMGIVMIGLAAAIGWYFGALLPNVKRR